jgi:murein DD-endopeptidase MepM/ murein hydrolase activator NlpD
MSNVVNGTRGLGHLRAVLNLTLGCVLLSGCSAGSDRFTSASFGTGYNAAPRTSQTAAASPKFTDNAQQQAQTRPANTLAQPAAYQPQAASGYQLASANADQSGGYMQASRVDLPPLPPRQPSQGTKLADGYGPGNPPPLADGTYTGPRVVVPYDRPRTDAPYDGPRSDMPPMGVYTPEGGDHDRDPGRYDRSDAPPPPPSNFYRRSETPPPPAYEQREETRVYEPKPSRNYSEGRRYEDGERSAYNRDSEAAQPAPRRPWTGRTDGEMVEVGRSDTVYTLARRYGVTVDMIARANGLSTVYVRPGTKLFIPRADPASFAQPQPQSQAPAQTQPKKGHAPAAAAKDETRPRAAPADKHAAPAEKTDGNAGAMNQAPKPSVQGAIPLDGKVGQQSALKAPAPVQPAPALVPDVRTAGPVPMGETTCEAALSNPQPRMGSTFRTPVDGKTIAPFGAQKDGTVNEGITISVPKGTPVKAAENGVVAYVGDELPGFGNLILIRHADEYVTAYAHADTVEVKKCQVVKRGQTIATAGTTGDASQPQVHFEIRKNSKPVDPSPLLGS